jgi:hypothetical protein
LCGRTTVGDEALTVPMAADDAPSHEDILGRFTLPLFERELQNLRAGTSPGPSGWNVDLLKKICKRNKPFLKILYELYRAMFERGFFPACFFAGSIIALEKPGSVRRDPRPICVPEVFGRLASRVILRFDKHTYAATIPET